MKTKVWRYKAIYMTNSGDFLGFSALGLTKAKAIDAMLAKVEFYSIKHGCILTNINKRMKLGKNTMKSIEKDWDSSKGAESIGL